MARAHNDASNSLAIAQVVRTVIKEVPVYQDAIQPLAKQIGRAGETVGEAINLALAPIKITSRGAEIIAKELIPRVLAKLRGTGSPSIQSPPLRVAGPAVAALIESNGDQFLQELFSSLLASSMDVRTSNCAHPAFVEIIKQLTPADARVLSIFRTRDVVPLIWIKTTSCAEMYSHMGNWSGVSDQAALSTSLANLSRLGLLSFSSARSGLKAQCRQLAAESTLRARKAAISRERREVVSASNGECFVDGIGRQFIQACLK